MLKQKWGTGCFLGGVSMWHSVQQNDSAPSAKALSKKGVS